MSLYIALVLMTVAIAVALVWSRVRAHRISKCTWDQLVARIQPVGSEGVTVVALDHLAPAKNQLRIEPEEMWNLLGGLEGLKRMQENATVLIALAAYAERWNYCESVIVAERMRRDALAVRRAVRAIRRSSHLRPWLTIANVRLPFLLHDAAGSYYLMRQRLLALYETSHAGRYPRLAAVV